MPKVLAATPQTIAAIRKMSHIPVVMNSRGPQHIPIGGGGGGGGGYSGYFKVIDASTKEGETTTLKVKVVDGSNTSASICGYAIISDTQFEITAAEVAVSESGFLYLKATVTGTGDSATISTPEFEFQSSHQALEDNVVRVLIARVSIDGTAMTIAQEQHGEIRTDFIGSCDE